MAGIYIEDGTGSNNKAKVDKDYRLYTRATVNTQISHITEKYGEGYSIGTPLLSTAAYPSFYNVLYVKNNVSNYNLIFSKFWLHWNGGNVNKNRCAYAYLLWDCNAPSANNTDSSVLNLNRSYFNNPNIDFSYWDGNNSGMTIDGGSPGFFTIIDKGQTEYDVNGSVILSNGNSLSLLVCGEEAGLFSIDVSFYMKDQRDI